MTEIEIERLEHRSILMQFVESLPKKIEKKTEKKEVKNGTAKRKR